MSDDKKQLANSELQEESKVIEETATQEKMEEAKTKEIVDEKKDLSSDAIGPRTGKFRAKEGGRDHSRGGKRKRPSRFKKEEKEFDEELLQIDRVTRVVKGGRRLRFRATVVIGDRKGRVGFGVDKATEVPQAIQKAVASAKKNLIRVPIENGTIPHEVIVKFGSARVMIMPAKTGTGIIAGGSMRKIADLAGIEDIVGKSIGNNNKITSGKAMIKALSSFRSERKVLANEEK